MYYCTPQLLQNEDVFYRTGWNTEVMTMCLCLLLFCRPPTNQWSHKTTCSFPKEDVTIKTDGVNRTTNGRIGPWTLRESAQSRVEGCVPRMAEPARQHPNLPSPSLSPDVKLRSKLPVFKSKSNLSVRYCRGTHRRAMSHTAGFSQETTKKAKKWLGPGGV